MASSFLNSLPPDYLYHLVNVSDENTVFRTKGVQDEASVQVWLDAYSDYTKTAWRKARTYPNSHKSNLFKIDLKCVHCTDRRVKGTGPSKHTNCPAKLQIMIKNFFPKSKAQDIDSLTKDWPTIMTLKGKHNHLIESAVILKHRDMSQETIDKLRSLFRQGHSPSSALHCLKTDLLLQHGDAYFKFAADGHYVPSQSVTYKLFDKEFAAEYGTIDGEGMQNSLQKVLEAYNNKKGSTGMARFFKTKDKQHYFVVMCSPLMMRVHTSVVQTKELVMVDAAGGMDKQRHRVYFFITPSAAGGLPVGVIITDSEKEYVFNGALVKFREILPEKSFYGQKFPLVFLTDNDLKEKIPLKQAFPQSTLLLCQFHFLKALWTWLCCKKHKIDISDRQELYNYVKNVLYSATEDQCLEKHKLLLVSKSFHKYPNFIKHYQRLWENKQDWLTYIRQKFKLRGNNTTNYIEVVFRILKDCILNRIMTFNLTQLVDYILTRYEIYMEKRLFDFFNGRYSKTVLKKMLPKKTDDIENYTVLENPFSCYNVINKTSGNTYNIDISNGVCSCMAGQSGKLCKHAGIVLNSFNKKIETAYNLASITTKNIMFFVATGKTAPENWLVPLNEMLSLKNEIPYSLNIANENVTENLATNNTAPEVPTLSPVEENDLENLVKRIKDGIKSHPEIFVPATQKMLQNSKKYAQTETGLISAMHTFATYSGLRTAKQARNNVRRCHASMIGVQPTAIGRRKAFLTGKKRVSAGRPRGKLNIPNILKTHDYTSLGSLPTRKRKAIHNLQESVYSNRSLGSTKQAKT